MTQEPQLSAEKVAELERRLADAAAEVARVQAQLQQVSGTPAPPAPTPAAGPHQISIDGQPVAPGTGNLFQLLQQLGVGASASGAGPVVVVNGQAVSGGQPVDLSAYLDPQTADRVRASLGSLGLGDHYGALFGLSPVGPTGGTDGGPPGSVAPVARLAEPPRSVPLAYRLATFDLSFYELFLLVILTAAPVIVWIMAPMTVPAALLAALATIAWFRGRRYRRRIGLLRWGRVAAVTNHQVLTEGTYYSGLTYNNMRKRSATGWHTTAQWYSGPAYTNQVDYTTPEGAGTLTYRGLRYVDGVVLADSRDPSRAMTVEQFPYGLEPGPDGELPGRLSPGTWIGIVLTLGVEIGLVVATVLAVLGLWIGG